MKLDLRPLIFCSVLGGLAHGAAAAEPAFRIVTLDPGHFHAALVHRESYPDVDDRVHVYGPLSSDLIEHLKRVARFNERAQDPTHWTLEVHTGPDALKRMATEKAGNVVVISGKNRPKLDAVQAAVGAGFHALVDKPWILASSELPRLREAVATAETNGRLAARFPSRCSKSMNPASSGHSAAALSAGTRGLDIASRAPAKQISYRGSS